MERNGEPKIICQGQMTRDAAEEPRKPISIAVAKASMGLGLEGWDLVQGDKHACLSFPELGRKLEVLQSENAIAFRSQYHGCL